jgi:ubiquinone/menaquinone biosynthesis C-methylase UbiE
MERRETALQRLYQTRFAANEVYRTKVWSVICRTFFSKYVSKSARIMDLGAGWGEFISTIEAGEKFAMDLNPATRDHLPPEVTHLHHDCSQPWPVESDTFDVVFTSNFLEHLPDRQSIERTAAEAYRCLKYNGLLLCMGPNIKYVHGAYWDFWDHHIPLTDQSCAELLRNTGFTIERSVARFLPYSMSGGSNPPILLVDLYLRLPILWPVFGKQFLVMARKAATPTSGLS